MIAWVLHGDGWMFVAAGAYAVVVCVHSIWMRRVHVKVYRLEARIQGLAERISYANERTDKVTQEMRRVTGKFDAVVLDELQQAAARIKERIDPNLPDVEDDVEDVDESPTDDDDGLHTDDTRIKKP